MDWLDELIQLPQITFAPSLKFIKDLEKLGILSSKLFVYLYFLKHELFFKHSPLASLKAFPEVSTLLLEFVSLFLGLIQVILFLSNLLLDLIFGFVNLIEVFGLINLLLNSLDIF